jgi:hypothetical protein
MIKAATKKVRAEPPLVHQFFCISSKKLRIVSCQAHHEHYGVYDVNSTTGASSGAVVKIISSLYRVSLFFSPTSHSVPTGGGTHMVDLPDSSLNLFFSKIIERYATQQIRHKIAFKKNRSEIDWCQLLLNIENGPTASR